MSGKIKIRASQLGKIMASIDKPEKLPVGAITEAHELYLWNNYKVRKEASGDAINKGNENEEQSITLLSKHLGRPLFKNEKILSDDYFIGTPDIIEGERIIDIKTPQDIFTFHRPSDTLITKSGLLTTYGWQVMVYMHLADKDEAYLAYCLTDTPDWIVADKLYRMTYGYKGGEDDPNYIQAAENYKRRNIFDYLKDEKRAKVFKLYYSEAHIELAQRRIEAFRDYYNTITEL